MVLSKLQEISYRHVLDSDGNFSLLELVQGSNVIQLKLGNTFAQGNHSYVWDVLRDQVDKQAQQIHERASKDLIDV